MRIGELARRSGIEATAIRYYESVGLLAHPARVGSCRDYRTDAVDRLRLIQAAKHAGFTLSEIRELTALITGGADQARWQAIARAKLAELDASIAALNAARGALAGAMNCACDGDISHCDFVAAAEGRRARR